MGGGRVGGCLSLTRKTKRKENKQSPSKPNNTVRLSAPCMSVPYRQQLFFSTEVARAKKTSKNRSFFILFFI